MSNNELSAKTSPDTITGPLSAEEMGRLFCRRSDLTYRTIQNLTLSGVDIYQSLLTGSLIRDSVFSKVIFSRSDLNGVRVEGSKFVECDFTSCDFRSSVFAHCIFQACILNSAFIDDCEFQMCEFTDCTFMVSSLTHCRFRDSSLSSCDLAQATFLHNKLYGTKISDMVLGNCALQYIILRNCTFERVTLSTESVGAMFGLTREQLSKAKMVYLGKKQAVPGDAELISLLFEEYGKRRWYIGQLVLALNFQLSSAVSVFDAYLLMSRERFVELGFASGEETEFLGDLIQELAAFERVPFLTVLNALEWCGELESEIKRNNQGLPESSGDSLRTLASRVALLANSLLDKLGQSSPVLSVSEDDTPVCTRVTFDEKPDIALTELLNSLAMHSPNAALHKSSQIRFELGSYTEIVLTTLFSLMAFQAFLFLINGCVIQLTELKHRAKVLVWKDGSKSYRDMALSPSQSASPIVLSVLTGLTQYAKGLGWLRNPSLSGYAAPNIKSVQVVECDDQVSR